MVKKNQGESISHLGNDEAGPQLHLHDKPVEEVLCSSILCSKLWGYSEMWNL